MTEDQTSTTPDPQSASCPECGAPTIVTPREVVMLSSDGHTRVPTGIIEPKFTYAPDDTALREANLAGLVIIDLMREEQVALRAALYGLKGPSDGGRRQCWCGPNWDHGYHTDTCYAVQQALGIEDKQQEALNER